MAEEEKKESKIDLGIEEYTRIISEVLAFEKRLSDLRDRIKESAKVIGNTAEAINQWRGITEISVSNFVNLFGKTTEELRKSGTETSLLQQIFTAFSHSIRGKKEELDPYARAIASAGEGVLGSLKTLSIFYPELSEFSKKLEDFIKDITGKKLEEDLRKFESNIKAIGSALSLTLLPFAIAIDTQRAAVAQMEFGIRSAFGATLPSAIGDVSKNVSNFRSIITSEFGLIAGMTEKDIGRLVKELEHAPTLLTSSSNQLRNLIEEAAKFGTIPQLAIEESVKRQREYGGTTEDVTRALALASGATRSTGVNAQEASAVMRSMAASLFQAGRGSRDAFDSSLRLYSSLVQLNSQIPLTVSEFISFSNALARMEGHVAPSKVAGLMMFAENLGRLPTDIEISSARYTDLLSQTFQRLRSQISPQVPTAFITEQMIRSGMIEGVEPTRRGIEVMTRLLEQGFKEDDLENELIRAGVSNTATNTRKIAELMSDSITTQQRIEKAMEQIGGALGKIPFGPEAAAVGLTFAPILTALTTLVTLFNPATLAARLGIMSAASVITFGGLSYFRRGVPGGER